MGMHRRKFSCDKDNDISADLQGFGDETIFCFQWALEISNIWENVPCLFKLIRINFCYFDIYIYLCPKKNRRA